MKHSYLKEKKEVYTSIIYVQLFMQPLISDTMGQWFKNIAHIHTEIIPISETTVRTGFPFPLTGS